MLADYITHYYEATRGPFLNICDLPDAEATGLLEMEKGATIGFNRFAMGEVFLRWRREADDLLIRAYREKFGHAPEGRPYFGVLGTFDRTFAMFREGKKIEMEVAGFEDCELTFMYPDHSHLLSVYESEVTRLFYDLAEDEANRGFRGRLFTMAELRSCYSSSGIAAMIAEHRHRGAWAGCYVEAHLWRRSLRRDHGPSEEGLTASPSSRARFAAAGNGGSASCPRHNDRAR